MDSHIRVPRAAGIVPARRTNRGWRVLVLRARRSWDFPNGDMRPNEDPVHAARRETRAETGLTDLRFPFGPVYRDPAPYTHGQLPRYYLAVTEQAQVTVHGPGGRKPAGHNDARWVSFDDASNLLPPRLVPVLNWSRRMLAATAGRPRDEG